MLLQVAPTPPPPADFPPIPFLIVALLGSLPLLGVVTWGAVRIFSPIAQAIGRRISGGQPDEMQHELADLQRQVGELRAELTDTQERLDFAERMLATRREPDRLPG